MISVFLFLILISISCDSKEQKLKNEYNTWHQYGGGADQSRFVKADQINKENVGDLEMAWFYPTMDEREYMFNPIVVDSIMYLVGKNQSLIALNASTGEEIWIHANLSGITWKGLNYWESPNREDRRLIFCKSNTIQEIDALTGKSILSFGDKGIVKLKEGLDRDTTEIGRIQSTTPGCLFENLIIIGSSTGESLFSSPGHLRAYDVLTGEMAWIFHTIPHPGEFGYETWPKDAYKYAGGVNTWGEISLDKERGIAYFPIGSPTYDYYGADRKGSNLFGNSLLALDARTGKRLWHYQMVHHDLWDYDNSAAPQLLTITHEGKKRDVVAQATKQGFVYVFDRVTGEPIWPIEERPVPQSDVPEEETWATQPFPVKPPPFTRHKVTPEDINPYYSDEEKEKWRARIEAAKTEFFSPPSDKYETIVIPGAVGGANFGNTAANPEKGLLYVISQEYPSVYKLSKVEPPKPILKKEDVKRAKELYQRNCMSCHGESYKGGVGPSLEKVGLRVSWEEFKGNVFSGKGQMPGFPHIDENSLASLYKFLGGSTERKRNSRRNIPLDSLPDGPVVASGGAPAGKNSNMYRRGGLKEYPAGVIPPKNLYRTDYGLQYMDLMSPRWSSIFAYDLNEGTIKWQMPIGHDDRIPKEDGKEKGIPSGSARKGMIVTSTGIVFSTAKGGKIYAFDEDNGEVLWSHQFSNETTGLPSMYELNGTQYLIVSATASFTEQSTDWSTKPNALPSGYVVFTLPKLSRK